METELVPETYMKAKSLPDVEEPPEPSQEEKMELSWTSTVSPAQEKWMKTELKKLGLLPGTPEYNVSINWEGKSLWRTPPPGELQKLTTGKLPNPDHFWLHPMFVWSPEIMLKHLAMEGKLPCFSEDCTGEAKKKGVGKPRVVVGSGGGCTGMPDTGLYYILASQLQCTKCKRSPWYADNPSYLSRLPPILERLFPAHVTYRKAICRSLVDQIRRSGRSPSDVVSEVKQLLHERYKRSHLQYLQLIQHARHRNFSFTSSKNTESDLERKSSPFGSYGCPHGWRGTDVSEQFIANVVIAEYNRQKPYLSGMLKGTFDKYWRSDHTRTLAKKVELLSGVMWSYSTLNEFWEIVSWVMVDNDSEGCLSNYYKGLSRRYELAGMDKASIRWVDRWCCVTPPTTSAKKGAAACFDTGDKETQENIDNWNLWIDEESNTEEIQGIDREKFARKSSCRVNYNSKIEELLDAFHCICRLGRACFSEAHAAYPRFLSLLANAFFVVDTKDLEALKVARSHLGLSGDPSKKEVRRHCKTLIPPPAQLEKRVQAALKAFLFVKDSRGVYLYTPRMLQEWKV